MRHTIAATIVVYRPQRSDLLELLRAIAGDVERIFLFANSTPPPDLLEACAAAAAPTPTEVLGSGVNVGLGRAYNEAARAAHRAGCDLLLLFDEDSRPQPGVSGRLADAFDLAGGCAGRVAVVGPRPVDECGGGSDRVPLAARGATELPAGLREFAFVISSGSLIDLAAFAAIGPFREDFFIDGIDIEWCFRAWARGYRCVMSTAEEMPHQFGRGVIRVPLLNIQLIDSTPARLFTFARNQIAMMRLRHVPLRWKLRIGGTMVLRVLTGIAHGQHREERAALLRGIRAGWRLELGPPGGGSDLHPI